MDDKNEELLAVVYYDNRSKSILLNVSGFKDEDHGKSVATWILKKLKIETINFSFDDDIFDNNTSLH